jgi:putative transposase
MMTSKSGFAKSLGDEVKKARFSEQKIIEILKLAEAGTKVADLCRKHGISQWTFYQWRSKYGGLGMNEAKRLKELEEENRRCQVPAARCARLPWPSAREEPVQHR